MVGLVSLQTHFDIIRFAVSQPGANSTEYYSALVKHFARESEEEQFDQLLYRLSFTNYKFSDSELRRVEAIAKRNAAEGASIFLTTEDSHEVQDRKRIVQVIVESSISSG
jgi:hypothetical protein